VTYRCPTDVHPAGLLIPDITLSETFTARVEGTAE